MGYQIVILKYKADGVIAIGIPVAVLKFLGGFVVDAQIAAVVSVQTTDDIEHSGLSAAGRAEYRDKLILTEFDIDAVKSCHLCAAA